MDPDQTAARGYTVCLYAEISPWRIIAFTIYMQQMIAGEGIFLERGGGETCIKTEILRKL